MGDESNNKTGVQDHQMNMNDRIYFVDSTEQFHAVLSPVLAKSRIIALDCEGSPDLSKTGTLCVLQLCAVISNDNDDSDLDDDHHNIGVTSNRKETSVAFVVDALADNGALIHLLKPVLESDTVLKVIHDVRRDAEALFFQYDITLRHVLDTQVAYRMLLMSHFLDSRHYRNKISITKQKKTNANDDENDGQQNVKVEEETETTVQDDDGSIIEWSTLTSQKHLMALSRIYGYLVHAIHHVVDAMNNNGGTSIDDNTSRRNGSNSRRSGSGSSGRSSSTLSSSIDRLFGQTSTSTGENEATPPQQTDDKDNDPDDDDDDDGNGDGDSDIDSNDTELDRECKKNQLMTLIRSEITKNFASDSENQIQGLSQIICDIVLTSHLHPNSGQTSALFSRFVARLCYSIANHVSLDKKTKLNFATTLHDSINRINTSNLRNLLLHIIRFLNRKEHVTEWPVMSRSVARQMSIFHFKKMLLGHARFLGELYMIDSPLVDDSYMLHLLSSEIMMDDDVEHEFDKVIYQDFIFEYLSALLPIVGRKLGEEQVVQVLEKFNWLHSSLHTVLCQSVLEAIRTPKTNDSYGTSQPTSLNDVDSTTPLSSPDIDTPLSSSSSTSQADPESGLEPKTDNYITPLRTMLADISLVKLLLNCTDIDYSEKMEHRSGVRENPEYWKTRPLTSELVDIAAKDVLNLIPLYESIRFLTSIERFRYGHNNFEHIQSVVLEKSDLYASSIRLFGYVDSPPASFAPFDLYNKQFVKFEYKAPNFNPSKDQMLVVLDVKTQSMGRIIGRFGRNLQTLQIMSPAVNVFTFRTAANRLYLIGIEDDIQRFIKSLPKNAHMFVHKDKLARALGNNALDLGLIEEYADCSIFVFEHGECHKLRFCGNDTQIDQAKRMVSYAMGGDK